MPLFEFQCADCGNQFEKLVRKAGVTSDVTCPVCRSARVRELLSTFASPSKEGSGGTSRGGCRPAGG